MAGQAFNGSFKETRTKVEAQTHNIAIELTSLEANSLIFHFSPDKGGYTN